MSENNRILKMHVETLERQYKNGDPLDITLGALKEIADELYYCNNVSEKKTDKVKKDIYTGKITPMNNFKEWVKKTRITQYSLGKDCDNVTVEEALKSNTSFGLRDLWNEAKKKWKFEENKDSPGALWYNYIEKNMTYKK